MSKSKKGAKPTSEVGSKKDQAREAFVNFVKENELSMKEAPSDKKLAKQWSKLKGALDAAKAETAPKEETEKPAKKGKTEKPAKKAKAAVERATKYDYPEDCVSSDDKKKFRTTQRALAKKEAKAETKAEKPAKKGKVKEEEVKASKKGKKSKKEETED